MVRTIDKEKDIITYGIDPAHWNDGSKYFRIDEKTGQIFVRESLAGQVRNFFFFFDYRLYRYVCLHECVCV